MSPPVPHDRAASARLLPWAAITSCARSRAWAWRWGPEVHEVAETLPACGLAPETAETAAAVLGRWERDKDRYDLPLAEALAHLRDAPAPAELRGRPVIGVQELTVSRSRCSSGSSTLSA